MNEQTTITCSLCGSQFDPADNAACPTCPLNRGCKMVCCPVCGNTNINPAQSSLVRLVTKIFGGKQNGPALARPTNQK